VAREVVLGLAHDFLARDGRYWALIGHPPMRFDGGHPPMRFDEAARRALAAERAAGCEPEGFWGRLERALETWAQRVGKRAA
jgi:hypothetical protein